jgi:N4-(beta-N-acetylglucosaminyl)-L-asparaginase
MADYPSRRAFLLASAAAAAAGRLGTRAALGSSPKPTKLPVVISSANGLPATQKAAEMIGGGADALDAVVAGVNIVEADPSDHSVGYGGLPNEEGVVELDSCVMHGPTHNAGAVAALRNIMHPSQVAKLVMSRTDHVLIVGEGALKFAKAHGFKEVDLLTDEARRIWLKWKETHSDRDDWLSPAEAMEGEPQSRSDAGVPYTYGTIHCSAVDANGDISGVTTTSGLSYKIPGRVGDSPIIGAGCYVHNEVGAAGSTGRGEAVIKNCGSFTAVELMRQGKSPAEACLEVVRRIAEHTKEPRLLNDRRQPNFDVTMYAISKDGRFGAASIWSGAKFAVYADGRNRLEDAAWLYERS